jgi:hypothetical protein
VHVGHPDAGAERGADRLPGDDRAGAGDLREGDVALGAGVVELDRGGGAPLGQPLHAGEQRPREGGLRLLRPQLRLLDRDVEGDEDRAGLDDPTRREPRLAHGARDLVAQGDRAQGEHGADGRGDGPMLALGRDGGGDRLGGLRVVGGGGGRVARGRALPGGEQSAGGGDRREQGGGAEPAAGGAGGSELWG